MLKQFIQQQPIWTWQHPLLGLQHPLLDLSLHLISNLQQLSLSLFLEQILSLLASPRWHTPSVLQQSLLALSSEGGLQIFSSSLFFPHPELQFTLTWIWQHLPLEQDSLLPGLQLLSFLFLVQLSPSFASQHLQEQSTEQQFLSSDVVLHFIFTWIWQHWPFLLELQQLPFLEQTSLLPGSQLLHPHSPLQQSPSTQTLQQSRAHPESQRPFVAPVKVVFSSETTKFKISK